MFQAEQQLLHRHLALAYDTGRIEKDQAGHEAQDQLPAVGIFPRHLAGLCRQQVLQGPEGVFNRAPPLPGPDQAGCRDGRGLTEQIVTVLPRFVDDDHGDRTWGLSRHGQSARASSSCPVPRWPSGCAKTYRLLPSTSKVPSCRAATCAINFESPNHLSAITSAAGSDKRRRRSASQVRSSMTCSQVNLSRQGRPNSAGSGRRTVKSTGMISFPSPITTSSNAIDAKANTMFLAAVPGTHQAQLLAILLEDTVVSHPRPLAATAGGGAFVCHVPPQAHQPVLAQALRAPDPFLLGQRAQDPPGQVPIPAPDPAQLPIAAAAKCRGKHHPKHLAHELLLGLQAPLHLFGDGLWQLQLLQGLF
jgi:hypothetical protein